MLKTRHRMKQINGPVGNAFDRNLLDLFHLKCDNRKKELMLVTAGGQGVSDQCLPWFVKWSALHGVASEALK